MTDPKGAFIWYELLTTDAAAAVPGDDEILIAADPQGAMFALVARSRENRA